MQITWKNQQTILTFLVKVPSKPQVTELSAIHRPIGNSIDIFAKIVYTLREKLITSYSQLKASYREELEREQAQS